MKIFILGLFHLLVVYTTKAQVNQGNCPTNIDFEFGNFTNWQAYIGTATNLTGMTLSGPVSTRHTLLWSGTSAGINDPYGNFPVLCPNGSGYSVRLGNAQTGTQAERLQYVFTIPSSSINYSVTYYYAVVFQDPNHTASQQPKFVAKAYDLATGGPVSCASYEYVAASNLPGFQNSPASTQVRYKDWTPVTIDFSGYAGQVVVLEFTTADCTLGGHFGYAYVDVGANCITPVTGYAYCNGADSAVLTAPFGYQNYEWWNANYTTLLGNRPTISFNPPPPNGTVIHLDITPFPGFGCRDTVSVVMQGENPPDTPVAVSPLVYCQFQPPVPLAATPNVGYITRWYTTAFGGTPLGAPPTPNTGTAGSTDYWVSQISFGGCEGPRKKVTVIVEPPAIPNFSINDTIQCVTGNNFLFTNTTTNGGAGASYSWDFGDFSTSVTTTDATHIYTMPGVYTVQLTATKGFCVNTHQITVTVSTPPIANFTAAAGCAGTVTAFANTTTGGSIQNSYLWDFGNGQTSTQANPNYTFTTPGIKTIKLSANDDGCIHDTMKLLTIYEVPKANFTYTSACIKDSIQFIDASTITTGIITNWNWDFGNGQTSTLQNPKMAFANFGPQNVKLQVSTANCTKDTTILVNVYEKPIAYFKRIDTACLNQPVQLQDSSYFTSGATSNGINTFWWSTGNNATYSSSFIVPTYSASNTSYLVQQVVTSVNGCSSDTNKVWVNVKPLPVARMNVLSNLCEFRPLSFEDISSPNIMGRTWTFSNGFVSNAQQITVSNLAAGASTLRLVVTDSFGCRSLPFDTALNVHKRPYLSMEYKDSCVERPVPFEAFDADINYITNWYWNFEGNTINGNRLQTHQFSKFGVNKYFVYGVAANGCVSDSMYSTVNLRYTPAYSGEDKIAAAGEAIQLNGVGGVTYEWTPSVGLSNANIQNPVATNNINRTYTLKTTTVFGCNSYDDVTISIYKGPDIYIPTVFTPNNDGINDILKITLVGIKQYDGIKIYNRWGKLIYESKDVTKGWDGTIKNKWADATETYVFYASGIDINGKKIVKKGTVILVR